MKYCTFYLKVYIVILSLFNFTAILSSQPSGWYNRPSGTTASLYSVYFVSASTGYAAGGTGIVRATTDGGDYWYPLNTGTAWTLYDIRFANLNTGWIVGAGGTIRKTTNGGTNWTGQTSGTVWNLYSCFFTNINTGWITGYGGIILKTTNGGTNWNTQTSGTYDDLNSIYFVSDNTGWCAGFNGTVIGTTNGGTNWNNYTNLGNTINSIHFISPTTGWLVGYNGVIEMTTNSGTSWILQNSNTTNSLYGLYFLPAAASVYKGWAVGTSGVIRYTSNSGTNWETQMSYTTQQLRDVFFINAITGWTVGLNGTILKTITGGLTGVNNENNVVNEFKLEQNYPNPFNPFTKIKFNLPNNILRSENNVKLIIYDILGKEIHTIINQEMMPGHHEIVFDGSNFVSGIYFYKLTAGDFSETKKFTLVK
jgi:photosystem II stability/assembly factor-like uncharacterized protein